MQKNNNILLYVKKIRYIKIVEYKKFSNFNKRISFKILKFMFCHLVI